LKEACNIHRRRRVIGANRHEANGATAVRVLLLDLVVQALPPAGRRVAGVARHVAVQLLNELRLEVDAAGVGVDHVEHEAVSRDLLLGAVAWLGRPPDELFDAPKRA
jgi:hypothetical protein